MRVMVLLGQDDVGGRMLFRLPKTRNADALAQVNYPHNVRALMFEPQLRPPDLTDNILTLI
jgi:hypothetical protein